jgi:hypothetical protein
MQRLWIALVLGVLATAFGVSCALIFDAVTGRPTSVEFLVRVGATCAGLALLVVYLRRPKPAG